MSFGYIYKITNEISNRNYIGFTTKPDFRFKQHLSGEGSQELYDDIGKFGDENFTFSILYKSKDVIHTLKIMEGYFIGLFHSHISMGGYNKTFGGEHPNYGNSDYSVVYINDDINYSKNDPKHESFLNNQKIPEPPREKVITRRNGKVIREKILEEKKSEENASVFNKSYSTYVKTIRYFSKYENKKSGKLQKYLDKYGFIKNGKLEFVHMDDLDEYCRKNKIKKRKVQEVAKKLSKFEPVEWTKFYKTHTRGFFVVKYHKNWRRLSS